MKNRYTAFINHTIIIIGGGETGYELYDFFKANPERGYASLGFFDDKPETVKDQKSYLGVINESINYAVTFGVDEIFCALPSSEIEKIEQLMLEADRNLIRFRLVSDYGKDEKQPTFVQYFGNIPVISIRPDPLQKRLNSLVKRLFDLFFSTVVIVFILSWLLPLLALLIKTGSKGPVLFVQLRSGRNNRRFNCYKFRSMRVNADADKQQTSRNDSRVTKLGAWMRKNSIDELPQFFNVFWGNMSVVGPRPHMISHTQQYAELIDRFMVRHFLKPGITGWAQINGLRGETKTTGAMISRVEADVWYLENWSFLLDLKIVFSTVLNLFKKDENAF